MRIMMRLLAAVIFLGISALTMAEPKDFFDFGGPGIGKTRNCTPSTDCTPTKDCSQPHDTRDCSGSHDTRNCRACILKNPFGGCTLRGNDPICEAAKAAQNSVYASKKAACEAAKASQNAVYAANKAKCEAEKASMKARCEATKSAKKLDCERLKQTQITTAEPYEAAIHKSKQVALSSNPRPIPPAIKTSLAPYFRGETLEQVRWTDGWGDNLSVQKYAMKFNNALAITFDYVIVFKSESLAENDIGLWAHELEHVKQYKLLGIDGFAQYYTHKESTIEAHATKQSTYVCGELIKRGIACTIH